MLVLCCSCSSNKSWFLGIIAIWILIKFIEKRKINQHTCFGSSIIKGIPIFLFSFFPLQSLCTPVHRTNCPVPKSTSHYSPLKTNSALSAATLSGSPFFPSFFLFPRRVATFIGYLIHSHIFFHTFRILILGIYIFTFTPA